MTDIIAIAGMILNVAGSIERNIWIIPERRPPMNLDKGTLILELNKQIAALEAAAKEREEQIIALENDVVQTSVIYEGISDVLRDGKTSDFMLSFPIVRQIASL